MKKFFIGALVLATLVAGGVIGYRWQANDNPRWSEAQIQVAEGGTKWKSLVVEVDGQRSWVVPSAMPAGEITTIWYAGSTVSLVDPRDDPWNTAGLGVLVAFVALACGLSFYVLHLVLSTMPSRDMVYAA